MVDQQFCLRWNNHKSTLISVFDTLLENNVLVDCTLAAEGQYLKAHKVVLCACSPYLERILSQHTERHPILILKDVKYQELKCMMDYMYKGEVNISQEQLETFLKAAESLQIKGLTDSGSKDDYRVANHSKRQEQTRKPPSIQLVSSTSPVSTPYSHSSALNELNVRQTSTSNVDAPLDASPNSRDRSLSPVPRKRKRPRRPSQTDSEHFDSASETPVQIQSTPMINVPLANQILSTSTSSTINDGTDQSLTVADIARFTGVLSTENIKKEKIESQPDNLIVPKTEFIDDVNEDGVEDLTLEEDIENMDGGPGPSHSSENSNQGYGWSIAGERSTDEIFSSQDLANTAQDNQEKKSRRGRPPGSKNRKTTLKKNDSNEIYYYGDWCSADEDNWQANSKVKRNRGRPPKRETIIKAELEQEYLNYPYFDENKQADLANRLNISVAYVSRWYEKRKNDMGRPRRGRPRKSVDTFSGSPIFCQTILEGDSENGHFSDAYFAAEERNILYNDFQKTELMKEFRKSPYISINEETALSKKLGLSEFQIRAWFSRMRFKANFSDSSTELTVGDFSNDDDDDHMKEEQANDTSITDGANESNVTSFQSELDNDPNNPVNASSTCSSPTHSTEQLTSEQVEKLEATYSISPTISYVMLNNLSNELRVSKKCIDDWFRAKRDDSKTESIVNVTDL